MLFHKLLESEIIKQEEVGTDPYFQVPVMGIRVV